MTAAPPQALSARAGAEAGAVALAGLAGGLAFGAAMVEQGDMLPTIAAIVRSDVPLVGFLVHMAVAAVIGAGFGLLAGRERIRAAEAIIWGVTYGAFWWFLGALTLLPLLTGELVLWTLEAARSELPSLVGHLVYGVVIAGALTLRRGSRPVAASPRVATAALARGATAGAAAAAALLWILTATPALLADSGLAGGNRAVLWVAGLATGGLSGGAYAALYPRPRGGGGPAMIRGLAYGVLTWVGVVLTAVPLLAGDGLAWDLAAIRARTASLAGFALAGLVLVVLYRAQSALVGSLFEDDPRSDEDEGAGTRVLRALATGTVAGLAGGLLFTAVLLEVDGLPTIGGLAGGRSTLAGLAVHLFIAVLIGASFAVLFRRETVDGASSLAWGVCYGVVWWFVGNLTLLPWLLGERPEWTAADLGEGFPSLVGHLLYGAGLGVVLGVLRLRSRAWWVSTSAARADRARRQGEQLLSAAPALWALVALIALVLPLLVAE
ncbi:MAG: hypothetical protein ACR2L8_12770 [Solirubrobacteraceae bacterium]